MRKVIALIHLSLDGFASGPNDELDWISYDEELEQYAHSMHDLTDAVIWGRKTYELMGSYWLTVPGNPNSTPAELEHAHWLDNATKVVVSRTLDRIDWNNTTNTGTISPSRSTKSNSSPEKTSGFWAAPTWHRPSCSLT